jgi:peptidoglycan/LPS O-acetylase OafA/YrhL
VTVLETGWQWAGILMSETAGPPTKGGAVGSEANAFAPDTAKKPTTANNFHLVRLVLSLMVVVCHLVVLPRELIWPETHIPLTVAAELGVQGFFVVSGYLIWSSYQRSSSLAVYAEKRARRLLPAYLVVVLSCAVAALLFTELARSDLAGVGQYLVWNLLFMNFLGESLPGLFTENRYDTVNGSLWTLKVEVLFYIILPVLAWLMATVGKYRWALLAAIYVASEIWRQGLTYAAPNSEGVLISLSRQLPGWMSFFAVGIAFAAWREKITWGTMLPLTGVLILTISIAFPYLEFVRAIGVGIVVIWFATGIRPIFDVSRFGDFSFGLYVVHFPIIQAIAATGVFAFSPWYGAAASLTCVFSAAALMWWFVERPALRADSAYRVEGDNHKLKRLKGTKRSSQARRR